MEVVSPIWLKLKLYEVNDQVCLFGVVRDGDVDMKCDV